MQDVIFPGPFHVTLRCQLFDPVTNVCLLFFFQKSPCRQLVVTVANNPGLLGTCQDLSHVFCAVAFFDSDDTRQDLLCGYERISDQIELIETDIAGTAAFTGIGLPEVLDQHSMTTDNTITKSFHRSQAVICLTKRVLGQISQHLAPGDEVADTPDQPAGSFQSVASGTTCFLLVMFQRFGCPGMNDIPHVGFVDSHPECDGGNDNLNVVVQEFILILVSFDIAESRMIGACFVTRAA